MAFILTSPAFQAGGVIPKTFTCDGPDRSPTLQWDDPPAATQSFCLIMDDPDAPNGSWTHWVLYNLPASATELSENVPKEKELPNSVRQGRNDFRKIGYGGPCPPKGPAHRYYFRLYALGAKTGLMPGATRTDLERAIKSHILATAELIGRYQR